MPSLLSFLSLATTLALTAGVPQTHGVHPSLVSRYTPKGTTWTCLDGSKTILWTAVNDDYCDCLDGSDEPGPPFPTVISPNPYKPY
jgi:protein kinase C substrate 80K-H